MFHLIAKAASDATANGTGSSGVESALVTCSGLDCTLCGLIQTVVNLFYYLTWYIAFPLAVLFLIIGGFIYIGSRGNERWMSFAKRAIIYTLGGFAASILAYMAINTLVQVVGGTNGGSVWSKFECGSDSTSKLKDLPGKKTADLMKSFKSGGELSGKLSESTSASDITQLLNSLKPSDMLIFESELAGQRKALMAVGKESDQLSLLFVDRTTINRILSEKITTINLIDTANAASSEQVDSAIQALVSEISQVTAKIIASKHDLFVVITDKIGVDLTTGSAVNSILSVVGKVDQCIETGGTWYRFGDICTAQKQSCNEIKCTPSGNDNMVASCKCPTDKCLSGGQCKNK